MVLVPCTILGGLPVIANCWFSGPDYEGEYDSGADEIYWRKRDGLPGKPVSEKVIARLEKYDSCWQADITEQASDWLGENTPMRDDPEPIWSDEYIALNGRRKDSKCSSLMNTLLR